MNLGVLPHPPSTVVDAEMIEENALKSVISLSLCLCLPLSLSLSVCVCVRACVQMHIASRGLPCVSFLRLVYITSRLALGGF